MVISRKSKGLGAAGMSKLFLVADPCPMPVSDGATIRGLGARPGRTLAMPGKSDLKSRKTMGRPGFLRFGMTAILDLLSSALRFCTTWLEPKADAQPNPIKNNI